MKKKKTSELPKYIVRARRRARLYALGTCLLELVVALILIQILSDGEMINTLLSGSMDPTAAIFLAILLGFILLILCGTFKYTQEYYVGTAIRQINEENREKERAQERRKEQELGFTYQAADSFYAECLKKGITDLTSSKANCQRALLLAQSRGEWNIPNIEERYQDLFRTGQQRAQAAKQKEKDQQRAAARSREERRAEKAGKLLQYRGREKRIQMLQELLDSAQAQQSAAFQADFNAWRASKAFSDATMEKEKDWSISAGLASGIGGVVAGAAVAGDIAAQNAGIRQRNEARRAAFAAQEEAAFKASMDRNRGVNASVSRLKRQLEESKLKLTDESIPAEKLMHSLKVGEASVMATEGGLIRVAVEVQPLKGWKIAGEVKGHIDGTITAKIYCDDHVVGQAYLTLPVLGLPDEEPTQLEGICPEEYTGGIYRAELEPAVLWIIEK